MITHSRVVRGVVDKADPVRVGSPRAEAGGVPLADAEAAIRRSSAVAHERAREQGYQAGYQEGLAQGHKAGRDAAQELVGEAASLIAAIDSGRSQLLADEKAEILGTVLACVEELIGDPGLANSPKLIESIVLKVLSTVERDRQLEIELALPQAALLRSHWVTNAPPAYQDQKWRIKDAADLHPTDVRIRFSNGELDGRLSVRLSELRETLLASARSEA